jgi:hypothetical protein
MGIQAHLRVVIRKGWLGFFAQQNKKDGFIFLACVACKPVSQ